MRMDARVKLAHDAESGADARRESGRVRESNVSRTRRIAAAFGIWLVLDGVVAAQDYPTQPVRFVVPYAAGGGTDAMARYFSKGLERRFGQPFVVENRPGSGTTIGANFVAKSAPDGQTILLGTSSVSYTHLTLPTNREV